MKKIIAWGILLALAATVGGCTQREQVQVENSASQPADILPNGQTASTETSRPGSYTGDAGSFDSPAFTQPLEFRQWETFADTLADMRERQLLSNNWENTPPSQGEYDDFHHRAYDVLALKRADDVTTLRVVQYDNVDITFPIVDAHGYESLDYYAVQAVGIPHAPAVPVAESIVELQDNGENRFTPISCQYREFDTPAEDYLKKCTAQLQNEITASERLDVSQYDKEMVEFVWKNLSAIRYIEKPEDITLYDLAAFKGPLVVYAYGITRDPDSGDDPNFHIDSALLALMTGLEELEVNCRLTDYSVFAGMYNLKHLALYDMNDAMFSTLQVGKVARLDLRDAEADVLDISGVDAEELRLYSYGTAVRGFQGCETIRRFYIHATRTDTSLINRDNFPAVQYLNLYFYSDTERVRNLSGLGTFADDVTIDVYLDYQACNNETLKSLAGVELRDLVLDPQNGGYPLKDLDDSLVDTIYAQSVTWQMVVDFGERIA